jgi:Flp pilus assembly protein TadD
MVLNVMGRKEEARQAIDKAIELAPGVSTYTDFKAKNFNN